MSSIIIQLQTPTVVDKIWDKIEGIITDKTPVWVWILGGCTAFTHWVMLEILPQFMEIIIENSSGNTVTEDFISQLNVYLSWYETTQTLLQAWLVIVLIEYIIRIIFWARKKYRGYKNQKKLLSKEIAES